MENYESWSLVFAGLSALGTLVAGFGAIFAARLDKAILIPVVTTASDFILSTGHASDARAANSGM